MDLNGAPTPLLSSGFDLVQRAIPFTNGVPFAVNVELGLFFFGNDSTGYGQSPTYNYTGSIDFSDTATLTQVLVTDSNGNPIPGETVTTAAGAILPVSPLNSPEPGFLLPLAILAAIGFGMRRRFV